MVVGDAELKWAGLRERVERGDREAFDVLVRAFWDRVARFFWNRAPAEDADDLTQNVFVELYQSLRTGHGPTEGDVASWRRYVLACARHRWIDHQRRKRVRIAPESLEALLADDASWEDLVTQGDREGGLVSPEEVDALHGCLEALEVLPRSLCWLHFVEEKSKREIARALRQPESSVRALFVRALQALRRCLEHKGISLAG